jgi:coenzyme F420-0:L-glutamate ligase/coenzyme F420-1:gamma-L-glutamate ligase
MSEHATAQAAQRRSEPEPEGLVVLPVRGIPEVRPGDDLGRLIAERAVLAEGDVVVVTQKIVSKAEGRLVPLDPEDRQARLALVLAESKRVLRRRGDLVIAETRSGFVCANAGIDLSNVDDGWALLLPEDPDRSARRIANRLRALTGLGVGVVVSDTFGRTWRRGQTDVAIGVAGVAAVLDLRGTPDANGRVLQATEIALADELASAAELVMGKRRGVPVALVRGVDPDWLRPSSVADELLRPWQEDLFR